MRLDVRCGLAVALWAAVPAEVFASPDAPPLTAEALAGPWTLTFTPGGKNVTVKSRAGASGPIPYSVQFVERSGRLTGCSVRDPAGEAQPARCTLQRGRLVVHLMQDGGNAIAFTLANTPRGVAGDASAKISRVPFSPKIGAVVLTRAADRR
jgi:hypothetical protein